MRPPGLRIVIHRNQQTYQDIQRQDPDVLVTEDAA